MEACTYYTTWEGCEQRPRNHPPNHDGLPQLSEKPYQKLMNRISEAPPCGADSSRRTLLRLRVNTCSASSWDRNSMPGTRADRSSCAAGISPAGSRHTVPRARRWSLPNFGVIRCRRPRARYPEAEPCNRTSMSSSIRIAVLEGYGLTESSPVLAIRTWKPFVVATWSLLPKTEIPVVDLRERRFFLTVHARNKVAGASARFMHAVLRIMRAYYSPRRIVSCCFTDGWLSRRT